MKRILLIMIFLSLVLLMSINTAQSAIISLDAMNTNSYATPFGMITFSGGSVEPGGYFQHDGAYMLSDYAEFNFDFDVDAINFTSSSLSGGIYTVAYDISNNEVDSYHTLDFTIQQPVSLSGTGIRRFIFADGRLITQGGGGWVDAESVLITTSAPLVPEPISSALFVVGGATLGFRRYFRGRQ